MSAIDTRFHQLLEKRLNEERQRILDKMGDGQAITAWDQYQKQVGILLGYRHVLTFSQEIEKEIANG